jgi:hypothetical protein
VRQQHLQQVRGVRVLQVHPARQEARLLRAVVSKVSWG